jgi:SpoVK/Ycf46/Vps4 family AAA+-type ATPase
MLSSREPLRLRERAAVRLDVRRPSAAEQRELWRDSLGTRAEQLNGQVDVLVGQFNFSAQEIASVVREAAADGSWEFEIDELWDMCRGQARPRLDDLAQRITSTAAWDDLVLPPRQLDTLREIAVHVRRRATVQEVWGFSAKSARGQGISALFAGTSGTGKTMAAEVLSGELQLDLYRIDLSAVVSKYIGETEKNLRRVFDAAESGSAILLFDEADALFGKRSEVKDSHDRYANIEVSYLLQRMEAYRGLAILTTNLKSALDSAFMRRIRFAVDFPFPDTAQRTEIWRRVFPAATPTRELDVTRLARLNVAGGNIHNIALHAAYRAADSGEPVRMEHLLWAARAEYAKLEKPLSEAEIGGWI